MLPIRSFQNLIQNSRILESICGKKELVDKIVFGRFGFENVYHADTFLKHKVYAFFTFQRRASILKKSPSQKPVMRMSRCGEIGKHRAFKKLRLCVLSVQFRSAAVFHRYKLKVKLNVNFIQE